MSMTLSGNGTITGLVSGGLPDGTVLPADLSTGGPYWDTSGNIGIGVTPSGKSKFEVYTGAGSFNGVQVQYNSSNSPIVLACDNSNGDGYIGANTVQVYGTAGQTYSINNYASKLRMNTGGFQFYTAPSGTAGNAITWTQAMILDTSGNLQFNSGYGSVATAYGCRAWVNFNGTGTVAIRASGNVSSITDIGIGQYTINFTNAMPDANYAVVGAAGTSATGGESISPISYSTASCQVDVSVYASQVDRVFLNVAIIR